MTYLKTGTRHTHKVIAEEKIGRPLNDKEVVHHIDENSKNNSPDNLEILPNQSVHAKIHFSGVKKIPKKLCKNGHNLQGDNVQLTSIGRRRCVICRKMKYLFSKGYKINLECMTIPGAFHKRNERGRFA